MGTATASGAKVPPVDRGQEIFAAKEKKTRGPRRVYSTILEDETGGTLTIRLKVKTKDQSAWTSATHTPAKAPGQTKNKNIKGAREHHPNVEAAKAKQEAMVEDALKLGWVKRERNSLWVAKPDQFSADNLPRPQKKEPEPDPMKAAKKSKAKK